MTPQEDLSGTQVGRYALTKRLGTEEGESIYLARAEGEPTPCLVRQLGGYDQLPRSHWETLMEAAQVAKQVSHPHLVQVLDFGQFDGQCFLATERIQGATLATLIDLISREEQPLELPEVVAIGLALSDALSSLQNREHSPDMPIVHGGLVPGNILLSDEGAVKLGGLGHRGARALGYQAPEVLMGMPPTARSDVFGLGVVLLELLTGKRLYDRQDQASTISAILSASEPPRPEHVDPDLRPRVDALFDRALAGDPEKRFESARAMHTELLGIATTLDIDLAPRLAELARQAAGRDAPDLLDIIPAAGPEPTVTTYDAPSASVPAAPLAPAPVESGFVLVASVAAATTAVVGTLVFLGLQIAAGAFG